MKSRVKKFTPPLILLWFIWVPTALPSSDGPSIATLDRTFAIALRPAIQYLKPPEGSPDQKQPKAGVVNLDPASTYASQKEAAPSENSTARSEHPESPCTFYRLGEAPITFLGPPVLRPSRKWGFPDGNELPRGSQLAVSLDQIVSTKSSVRTFTATVLRPMQSVTGWPTVPAGSKILGEATRVEGSQRSGIHGGSRALKLQFRELRLPNGISLPVSASLYSLFSTGDNMAKSSSTPFAMGPRFGSYIRGFTLQASVDGGYVLSTREQEIELPARTGLTLQLPLRFGAGDRERSPVYPGSTQECR